MTQPCPQLFLVHVYAVLLQLKDFVSVLGRMEDETTPPSLQEMNSVKEGKFFPEKYVLEVAVDEDGASDKTNARGQKDKPRMCTNALELECLIGEDEGEQQPPQPTSPRDRHPGFDRHRPSNPDGNRPLWILTDETKELKERAKRSPSKVWIAFVFLLSIPFIPIYLLYELYRRYAPTMYAECFEYCCVFACPWVANDCSGQGQTLPLRCFIKCLVTFIPIELCRDLRNEALKGISLQMWIACKYMVDWIYDHTAGPLGACLREIVEFLGRQLAPAKPYTLYDFHNDCRACWKSFSVCCCYFVPCKCCEADVLEECGDCDCSGCCKPCIPAYRRLVAACCPPGGCDFTDCFRSCSCNPRAWVRACYSYKLMDYTICKFLYFMVYSVYKFVAKIFKFIFNIKEAQAYQGGYSREGEYMIKRQVDVEGGYGTTSSDARDEEGRPRRFTYLDS